MSTGTVCQHKTCPSSSDRTDAYHVGITVKIILSVIVPRYRYLALNKKSSRIIVVSYRSDEWMNAYIYLLPSRLTASPIDLFFILLLGQQEIRRSPFHFFFYPPPSKSSVIVVVVVFQKQDDKKLGCHWWDCCCDCSWSIRVVGPNYRQEEEKER